MNAIPGRSEGEHRNSAHHAVKARSSGRQIKRAARTVRTRASALPALGSLCLLESHESTKSTKSAKTNVAWQQANDFTQSRKDTKCQKPARQQGQGGSHIFTRISAHA